MGNRKTQDMVAEECCLGCLNGVVVVMYMGLLECLEILVLMGTDTAVGNEKNPETVGTDW